MIPDNAILVVVAATHCQRCEWTLRTLERAGVPTRACRVDELTSAERAYLADQGYRSAPVVITPVGDLTGAITPAQARRLAEALADRRRAA